MKLSVIVKNDRGETKSDFNAPNYAAAQSFVQKIVDRGGIWCRASKSGNRYFVPMHRIKEVVLQGEELPKTKMLRPAK